MPKHATAGSWKKGQSGNPTGIQGTRKSTEFAQLCREILEDPDGAGRSMFQRAIGTLLRPQFGFDDDDEPCETCGRRASEYLVNDRVIADVVFRLAEFAHGKPRQQVEVTGKLVHAKPEDEDPAAVLARLHEQAVALGLAPAEHGVKLLEP